MILLVSALAMAGFGAPVLATSDEISRDPSWPVAEYNAVRKLIKQKGRPGSDPDVILLPDKVFKSLSFEQKFIYVMINGEDFEQNCDPDPTNSSPGANKKIFGVLPVFEVTDMMDWSDRETGFLKENRSRVIGKLRLMISHNDMQEPVESAIDCLEARELIPDLVGYIGRNRKNMSCVTVLLRLMKDGHYQPFLKSAAYRKLYGPNSDSSSFLVANQENVKLTVDRAMAYYQSRTHSKG